MKFCKIFNATRQKIISEKGEIADNPFTRMRGLLGRTQFNKGEALLICGSNSIHMFFMKFPIDVVFLDENNFVVGLVENIAPYQVSPVFWKAKSALELPAGSISKIGIFLQDQLNISSSL